MELPKCNMTAYSDWYNAPLNRSKLNKRLKVKIQDLTRADKKLWKELNMENLNIIRHGDGSYFDLQSFVLSNGQAIHLLDNLCKKSLKQLELDLAGTHGPVSDQSIHDEMCNDFCINNDNLRDEAMRTSKCTCYELSTKRKDLSYHVEGDWCRSNSGMLLCNELERCGIWECAIDDFHCRRREYNRKFIIGKGYGGDCGSGCHIEVSFLILSIITVLSVFHAS